MIFDDFFEHERIKRQLAEATGKAIMEASKKANCIPLDDLPSYEEDEIMPILPDFEKDDLMIFKSREEMLTHIREAMKDSSNRINLDDLPDGEFEHVFDYDFPDFEKDE